MMMKRIGAWMLLVLLALVGEWSGRRCYGCLEEERIGLLEIQSLIDPYGVSRTHHWVDNNSNCCEWYGIECDNTTRRVIQLSLYGARDESLGDWVLNASLFQPFKELQSLELKWTGLVGCMENEGFQVLSSKLRELDLSLNRFNNDKSILSCFNGNLSTLKSLDLSYNALTAGSGFEIISSHLEKLENLDLSYNNIFNYIILSHLRGFSSLKSLNLSDNMLLGSTTVNGTFFNSSTLEELHLDRTSLPIKFLQNIGALPALKVLSVGECDLHGTLPAQDNSFTGSIPNWIGNLSSLSVLLLRANHFDGELPIQLCLLEHLSILDVSQNQLSGPLPSCLGNLTFKESSQKAFVNFEYGFTYPMESAYYEIMGPPPVDIEYISRKDILLNFTEVIEFRTKNMYYGYMGKILNYMSGIDISNNNFVGAIPPEFGNLSEILSLNLSHNNLIGCIPATFSNLKHIESLDLSYNNLNGVIPPQLTGITTLEVFSVAHNNLSGRTPERKYQFGTFNESCYEGNPFLCGPPLRKNCSEEAVSSQPVPNDEQRDDGFIDMEFFYISFSVCYTVMVMTIAAVLYINPYWRRRWLCFIEDCIDYCYYFVVASFRKFSNFIR